MTFDPLTFHLPPHPLLQSAGQASMGWRHMTRAHPVIPTQTYRTLFWSVEGLDSTADSHSSQVPTRESSTCDPAERKEHGKRAPEGSRVKSTSWAGLKSTLPLTLQEVGGLHRVKLPHGFCRLGAQHPAPSCFLKVLGMDGRPAVLLRHEEMPPATAGFWLSPLK